jgi:Ni,Fe-hydrogenase I cytochrome b subunit
VINTILFPKILRTFFFFFGEELLIYLTVSDIFFNHCYTFEAYSLYFMLQVLNHLEGVRNPLPPSMHNFYVLIETTGSDESYDK